MSDKPQSYRDICSLYESRKQERDGEIGVYRVIRQAVEHGTLPEDYNRLFTESDVKIQLRTLRAARDSLVKFLSEIPILPHVPSLGNRDSATAKEKSEKVERVVYGYHNGSAMRGGVEFDGITLQLAYHQVMYGDGCLLVNPDRDRKLVYLEAQDPAFHYPPKGWHPWSQVPLDNTLLVYEMTLGEVKKRFCYHPDKTVKSDVMQRVNNAFNKRGWMTDSSDYDRYNVKVGVYRSREAWMIVLLGDRDAVLVESQEGDPGHPGVCGVASFKQFSGEPVLLGQLGIEAGLMKVINQQIQNTERINKATTIGPPLVGDELRIGEYNEVNMALMQGRTFQPYRMAPDSPGNLTQVLGSLLSLAQMFNYNPDSNMGAGDANSGKAIQQLQAGPRTLVTNILFSPYKPAFPRVYDDCMEMELNLWPNERKNITGYKGRERYEIEYTPSAALQGFKGQVKIEDARMGGYNAFLEAVQKKDAGMASLRTVLEKDPDIRNVEEELNRIDSESVEKFVNAAFEALGGTDPLTAIKASAEVKKRIDSGKSKFDAIQEVIAAGLLEPPAPPDAMAGGMPPIPPELMGALGGEEMPTDSLTAARGF